MTASRWPKSALDSIRDWTSKRVAFWIVIACLCICVFLRAIDAVIIPVILPSISTELHATSLLAYWTGSSYLFAQTIVTPIFGGLAEAMGRRTCIFLALGCFIAGSILCALAQSISWLIGARVLQGIGAGGIDVMVDIITVDLVPLKERAKYTAFIQMSGAFGMVSGMIFGAVLVQKSSWRLVFWVNLPLTIPPTILLMIFLRLKHVPKPFFQQIKSMDWTGIALLTGSLMGILYAVFSGGVAFPWKSAHVLAPIIIGTIGIIAFVLHQGFVAPRFKGGPIIPLRLFASRTAVIGYFIILTHAIILSSIANYYPLYLYLCSNASILTAAILMLPFSIVPLTCAAITGVTMSKTKRFKWLNVLGLVFLTAGLAATSRLTERSSRTEQVFLQFVPAIGAGILFPGRIMAVQAPQTDDDAPMATALISFFLSLGQCFGVALGGTIYQNVWDLLVWRDIMTGSIPAKLMILANDAERAAKIIPAFPAAVHEVYRSVMATSIDRIWIVMAGISAATLLFSVLSKNLSLDRNTKTKFGLDYEDDAALVVKNQGQEEEEADLEVVPLRETQTIPREFEPSPPMEALGSYEQMSDRVPLGRYERTRDQSPEYAAVSPPGESFGRYERMRNRSVSPPIEDLGKYAQMREAAGRY